MNRWLSAVGVALGLGSLLVPGVLGPALGLAMVVGVVALRDCTVLRSTLRVSVVVGAVFAASITVGMVTLGSDWERGVAAGAGLIIRLTLLWLIMVFVSRSASGEGVLQWCRRTRLRPFGETVGLAVNLLPLLVSRCGDVARASRQRGLPWWRGWGSVLEVLLAHAVRLGDGAAAAAALRGHSGLIDRHGRAAPVEGPVIVVTGKVGSGKTSAVEQVVERLNADGVAVFGVIQPRVCDGEVRVGFRVRDIATGEEAPFAERVARGDGEHGTRFRFSVAGAELARRALRGGGGARVLVVDELGPMELRGDGHADAVRRCFEDPNLACTVLVVRRHLVPALLASLDARDALVVDVGRTADPVERIKAAVWTRLDPGHCGG